MSASPTHLRDAGIAQRELHADPRLKAIVDKVIEDLADSGRPFSADDVRPLIPVAALGLVGGRVRSYLMRKLIVQVDEVRSTWPATHHKKIGLHLGAQHVQAVAS